MDFLRNELGLDAVIDYKHPTRSVEEQLAEVCSDGVEINQGARIVSLTQYDTGNPKGPKLSHTRRTECHNVGICVGGLVGFTQKSVGRYRFDFVAKKGIKSLGLSSSETLLHGQNTGRDLVDVTGDH